MSSFFDLNILVRMYYLILHTEMLILIKLRGKFQDVEQFTPKTSKKHNLCYQCSKDGP